MQITYQSWDTLAMIAYLYRVVNIYTSIHGVYLTKIIPTLGNIPR